jgi:acetyltransferase-like isoleucine patch superfamily enzyme
MKFNNRNVWIDASAKIGEGVRIGDNTTIYPNVEIGDGTVIANDCVIGEPGGDYYHNSQYQQPKTIIGKNSLIRSHSIVYSGCILGEGFQSGHRVCIRENTEIGDNCRVGTLCDLQGDLILGDNVWLHSNVHLGKGSVLASFVFIYPYVVLTNDPYPPSTIRQGVMIGEYSQIGASSTLMPGVKIGHDVLIGAGSNVTKDIPDFSLAIGNPARAIRDVRELNLPDGTKAYPWPHRFDRGMPWAGIGYEDWLNEQKK